MGDMLNGFAFNLQPWTRSYLENNQQVLNDYAVQPRQKMHSHYGI